MFFFDDLFVALFCSHHFDMVSFSVFILIVTSVNLMWVKAVTAVFLRSCWISWNGLENKYQNHIIIVS